MCTCVYQGARDVGFSENLVYDDPNRLIFCYFFVVIFLIGNTVNFTFKITVACFCVINLYWVKKLFFLWMNLENCKISP